jgi:hypothetical protein
MPTLKSVASAILAAGIAIATPLAGRADCDPATRALAYMATQQMADGSIAADPGPTEDYVFGAAAAGYDPNTLAAASGKTVFDYLSNSANLSKETASAGKTGKLILAVVAGGLNPSSFGGQDLIAKLNSFYASGKYGDGSTFAQAFSMLALEGAAQPVPTAAVTWLKGLQDTDGGWNYKAAKDATASDTNSTAIALEAMGAAGDHSADSAALTYLHAQQQADGGFGFIGPPSDPDSDALVVEALVAAGQNPNAAGWSKGSNTPMTNMLTFQDSASGGFFYDKTSPTPDAFTTSQVPQGLKLKPQPVIPTYTRGARVPSCVAAAAATASPSPAASGPSPSPTSAARPAALAQTGGGGGPRSGGAAELLAVMLVTLAAGGLASIRWRRKAP